MSKQQNAMSSFEEYLSEHKINTNDVDSMKRAIDDYKSMLKNQQEISVDVSKLDASALAKYVSYKVDKLTKHINDVDLSVFKEALNLCNTFVEKQNARLEALYTKRSEIQKEIVEIEESLGTSATIRDTGDSINRQQIASNRSNNSLQDCIDNSKNRRNATLRIFEYLDKNNEQLTVKEIVSLIESKYSQDDYTQAHSACVRNVSRERNKKYVHVLK